MKKHVLHASEKIDPKTIMEIGILLKSDKIVVDEPVKFGKEPQDYPYIYIFFLKP